MNHAGKQPTQGLRGVGIFSIKIIALPQPSHKNTPQKRKLH